MQHERALQLIESKYRSLAPMMDERVRRYWAAAEAKAYGWGGVSAVSSATGMSRKTIRKGLAELGVREEFPDAPVELRLRSPGGGRKRLTQTDPQLFESLEWLVDPTTRGDPMSPLRWTCKSTHELAKTLTAQGHELSPRTVGRLLNEAGFSLQSNRKTKEGAAHPDRGPQARSLVGIRDVDDQVPESLQDGRAVHYDVIERMLTGHSTANATMSPRTKPLMGPLIEPVGPPRPTCRFRRSGRHRRQSRRWSRTRWSSVRPLMSLPFGAHAN